MLEGIRGVYVGSCTTYAQVCTVRYRNARACQRHLSQQYRTRYCKSNTSYTSSKIRYGEYNYVETPANNSKRCTVVSSIFVSITSHPSYSKRLFSLYYHRAVHLFHNYVWSLKDAFFLTKTLLVLCVLRMWHYYNIYISSYHVLYPSNPMTPPTLSISST